MTDTPFEPTFVNGTYGDRVQRAAVLHRLVGKRKGKTAIIDGTRSVQRQWRALLTRLMQYDWCPRGFARNDDRRLYSLQFARNCLPTFLHCLPRLLPCNLRAICPFCYARQVREIWLTVDAAFPNARRIRRQEPTPLAYGRRVRSIHVHDRPLGSPPFQFKLVERRHAFKLTFHDDPASRARALAAYRPKPPTDDELASGTTSLEPAAVGEYTAWLALNLDEILARRRAWIQRHAPQGAIFMTTVEPWADCWYVVNRQLLMLPVNQALPAELQPGPNTKVREQLDPSRRMLVSSVARVFAYPSQLFRGDPFATSVILRARRRRRLLATYGSFRHTQEPNDGEPVQKI